MALARTRPVFVPSGRVRVSHGGKVGTPEEKGTLNLTFTIDFRPLSLAQDTCFANVHLFQPILHALS